MDETILGIHDGGLAIFLCLFLHTLGSLVASGKDFLCRVEMAHIFLGVLVILQEFDRQVSGGVALADAVICLQILLDMFDAMLYLMSVVDMDMTIVRSAIFLAFIEFDDGLEEFIYSSSIGEHSRNHGDSEELA